MTNRAGHLLETPRDDGGYWPLRAACRSMDPAKFEAGHGQLSAANREALAACARCPVRAECRTEWAALPAARRRGFIAGGIAWRGRKADPIPAPARGPRMHGTHTMYAAGGCRCQPCRNAHAAAERIYRRRRQEAKPKAAAS